MAGSARPNSGAQDRHPVSDWIALSDSAEPVAPGLLQRGLFVLEFALPLDAPTVLLQIQTDRPWPRTFSVFFDPAAGLVVVHRQGATLRRHLIPGPLPQHQGAGRLTFAFDAPQRTWRMGYELIGETTKRSARGTLPLPMTGADLNDLCSAAAGTQRHRAVLWFGATQGDTLPDRAPWIGLRTPVNTARGRVPAGLLRPGDRIATLDQGFLPLHGLIHRTLPSRGTFVPVLLRTPFFGLSGDILVSSDQLVLISGASVEYLYGVEEALISAASLCDGQVAQKDERRAVTHSVALDLGQPALVTADGCCLMSATGNHARLPRLALKDFEALPLLALLGRTALRHVA